jgi:hypothetical protein
MRTVLSLQAAQCSSDCDLLNAASLYTVVSAKPLTDTNSAWSHAKFQVLGMLTVIILRSRTYGTPCCSRTAVDTRVWQRSAHSAFVNTHTHTHTHGSMHIKLNNLFSLQSGGHHDAWRVGEYQQIAAPVGLAQRLAPAKRQGPALVHHCTNQLYISLISLSLLVPSYMRLCYRHQFSLPVATACACKVTSTYANAPLDQRQRGATHARKVAQHARAGKQCLQYVPPSTAVPLV